MPSRTFAHVCIDAIHLLVHFGITWNSTTNAFERGQE